MIKTIIEDLVGEMNANGDSFSFLHAEKDIQNVEADEATLPAVYLDMPIRYTPKTVTGGGIEIEYNCFVLFLYKSELDDNPDQRNDSMIKAMEAQRNFQALLYANPHQTIKSFTVGECYQLTNLFDVNVDAIAMPFRLVPEAWNSVCT